MRMTILAAATAAVATLAATLPGKALAGEGMWVPQQLPEISKTLKKAGLQLDPDDLADLTGDPMGAVVSLRGCTASFVSPAGFVIHNHPRRSGALPLHPTPAAHRRADGLTAP